jgi:hypothetical protein
MVQVSQTTKNLVNAFAKDVFGESVEETMAKAKLTDEKLIKSIILLYTRVDMAIDEIAEHLVLSNDVVIQILRQNKIIK